MSASEVRWAAPARGLRWRMVRRWALTGSLLLNAFLLAHAAAPMFNPPRARGFEGMVDHFAHNLPPADAERLRDVLNAQKPALATARREMDGARESLSRAIAAEPYDPALVRARMSDWQARLGGMFGQIGDTLLTAVPLLSPEGRAKLADAASHPPGPPAPDGPRETQPHP